MYRRYREHRRRRNYERRPRLFRMRPSTQIAILLVAALIVFLILQGAGR